MIRKTGLKEDRMMPREKKISHLKKPEDLTLEAWQIFLRKQVAREQALKIKNVGSHPVFSTFRVTNPKTTRTYRVVIAGEALGINYCSCPDFSVNTLGTCKHIESLLYKLLRQTKTREILKAGFHPDYSAVTLRYGLKRRAAFLMGKKASAELKTLAAQYFDKDFFLTEKGFHRFDDFIRQTKLLKDEIHYHEDAMEFIARLRDEELRKERIQKIFPEGIDGRRWESFLEVKLYPYQKEGALFAAGAGRCLIADDMGLGKTIQAIAASEIMARCFGIEKVLVICPASLKYQWKQEIERVIDRRVLLIQGTSVQRKAEYQKESFLKIINYDVVYQDMDVISQWAPDLIILDEAQRIKNWKTRLAQSVKQLKSSYAIVLTGTPLENRLEEIHSIVEFIDRHHLGPLFRFLDRHQVVNETGKVIGYKDLHDLGRSLQSILIRRQRSMVLKQLPQRIDKNYFVPMTPEQHQLHEDNREIVARLVSKWRRHHFLTEQEKQRLMMALQNMRMVCDDAYLVDQNLIRGRKVDELETQLREIMETPETKVVIFSQWLRMMELIIRKLKANHWKHVFLHGGVASHKRGDLIRTFRDSPSCRLFLSTEAGGVGLNLQNAAFVINMDLPWNPAVLEQRISRVHRLGQRQAVRVINFISEGGIEHGMLDLLKFKKSMFTGVLDQGDNEVFMGTTRFNQFMKTVEQASESVAEKRKFVPEAPEVSEEERSSQLKPVEAKEESGQGQVIGDDSLKNLLKLGASFLGKLSQSLDEQSRLHGQTAASKESLGIRLNTNKDTGRKSIEIPLPDEKFLSQLKEIVGNFLNSLKK